MRTKVRPYQIGGYGKLTLSGNASKPPMDFGFTNGKITKTPYAKWESPALKNIKNFGTKDYKPAKNKPVNGDLIGGAVAGAFTGAVAGVGQGIDIYNSYAPILEGIPDAKEKERKYNEFEGMQRIYNQPRTQGNYGQYPRKLQYGGYGPPAASNPYAGSWDPNLSNASYSAVEDQRNADMSTEIAQTVGTSVADGVSSAAGGVPIIGAAFGTQDMIHGITKREQIINPETGEVDTVYDNPDQALPSEFSKDAGTHTIDDFAQGDVGGGFANLFTGGLYGKIGDGIAAKKATEERDLREEKYKNKQSFGRTLGDVSYSNGNIMRGQKGGYLNVEKAELEDGEVIERAEGGDKQVVGNKHHEKDSSGQTGEIEYLKPGDFVWSEHLGFANKYKELVAQGASEEEIEMLRVQQQRAAGKPGYKGRTVKKYQMGTPIPIDDEGRLYDQRSTEAWKQWETGLAAEAREEQLALTKKKKKGKAPVVRDKSKDVAMTPMPLRPIPAGSTSAPAMSPYHPGKPYTPGKNYARTGAGRFLKDNSDALIAGAGAIGQIAGIASQTYKEVDPVSPGAPVKADTLHLTRVRDMEKGAREAELRAATKASLQSGAGPGARPQYAKAATVKHRQDEAVAGRVAEQNSRIDATERTQNVGNKLTADRFNAEMALRADASRRDEQLREQSFKNEKKGAIGDAIGGIARDVPAYKSDRDMADAIYGNTGINERALKGKEKKFTNDYKKANPKATPAEINRAWLEELISMT